MSITTTSLPNWTVNQPGYSVTISLSGGTAPYTFSKSAGTLPNGLTLNSSTGVLSGTPTSAATFSFTITATDTAGSFANQNYTVTINPAVTITTTTLADWTIERRGYSQTITATGGTGARPFAVTSGTVPTGLTLEHERACSPARRRAPAPITFTVTATDTVGATGPSRATRSPSIRQCHHDHDPAQLDGQCRPATARHQHDGRHRRQDLRHDLPARCRQG